jgi:polyribonucleotide nucleotidyltransferase
MGDTMVLATCVVGKEPSELNYLPLSVDYEERFYASGKISGSRFIKREGRPSEEAVLTARMIDRPIRPLFPKYFRHDIQIVITVLSYDRENDPDLLALCAASAAVSQSMAPFSGPVGMARVGLIGEEFKINPTKSEMKESDLDLVVIGTKERVMMIETAAKQVSEEKILEGIELTREPISQMIEAQKPFWKEDRLQVEDNTLEVHEAVKELIGSRLHKLVCKEESEGREEAITALKEETLAAFEGKYKQDDLEEVFGKFSEKEIRHAILSDGIRPDSRKLDELRPLTSKVGILPRTHGSALFARGQTQSLTTATLGSPGLEQFIDTMEMEGTKRYMHFYNFPPYSTGETGRVGSPNRREIGHGALAEKALVPVIPDREKFPYTIRLVSEILSSNGSSSMAAVTGSTLALMDAGVPITAPVAGIAMGLVTCPKDSDMAKVDGLGEDDKYKFAVLTDLQGLEDFGGDMDFKIAGTRKGITAIQLDTKIDGLSKEIIEKTFAQAKVAREKILDVVEKTIASPREKLSEYAPRIITVKINPSKIGELIGPGGKNIQGIITECGGKDIVAIDIEDDGTVLISSADSEAAAKAQAMVEGQTVDAEVGKVYEGEVVNIQKDRMSGKEIGAIVEILPGKTGMVHISEIAQERIEKVTDKVNVGDHVKVKVMAVDPERGRTALSIKRANEQ